MGNNYFSKYLATHFSEIIADRIGYAGWRQGANKGCISPRTQVSSSKPLSPIDISRERRWIINRAESSDFGFPRSTMKYATVLEGSFDPASGGERTSVKMELTPPSAQKSRVRIHPKLFAAIIRPDVLSRSGGIDISYGHLFVSFGINVIV